MRILLLLILSALTAFSQSPTPIFNLTSTNQAFGSNWLPIVMHPGATNGTRKINLTNLALALGPHITNSSSGTNMVVQTNGVNVGSGGTVNWTAGVTGYVSGAVLNLGATGGAGGAGVTTNANQFAAVIPLTLKSGVLVTNMTNQGTMEVAGTNRATQFHFRGGQTTGSVLYLDGLTNAATHVNLTWDAPNNQLIIGAGGSSSLTVYGIGTFDGALLPLADVTHNFGGPTTFWRTGYIHTVVASNVTAQNFFGILASAGEPYPADLIA